MWKLIAIAVTLSFTSPAFADKTADRRAQQAAKAAQRRKQQQKAEENARRARKAAAERERNNNPASAEKMRQIAKDRDAQAKLHGDRAKDHEKAAAGK